MKKNYAAKRLKIKCPFLLDHYRFEESAVKLYSSRADEAKDPEEKKIYSWLANWERQHSKILLEIDKALVETIWLDNKFWPF